MRDEVSASTKERSDAHLSERLSAAKAALAEIAETADGPCCFDMCNGPETLAECVGMLTCRLCMSRCIAVAALAVVEDA